jgi:hypothetical protein
MADDPCQVDEPDKAHEFQALVVQAIHAAEAASDSTHRLMRNLMEDEPSEALALGKVWRWPPPAPPCSRHM